MDLVLLPGNSVKNEEWIKKVEKAIRQDFAETCILSYKHWEKGENLMDFELELERLADLTQKIDQYSIFAKSAGVLLTLRGIFEAKIRPFRCVFAGSAIRFGKRLGFDVEGWLKKCDIPCLLVQKTNDPAISFEELEKLIKRLQKDNYKLNEISGEDHYYGDIEQLRELIVAWIKATN